MEVERVRRRDPQLPVVLCDEAALEHRGEATQIIVAIDSIGPGFNSHLLSDQSPVNAAISSLVLPSSFRPVSDPATPTGSRWELDPTLLVSAEVTNEIPFTVTYKIRPEAQWTDNAPIGADDYWYLWRQMVSQPGVVDPAGYAGFVVSTERALRSMTAS